MMPIVSYGTSSANLEEEQNTVKKKTSIVMKENTQPVMEKNIGEAENLHAKNT